MYAILGTDEHTGLHNIVLSISSVQHPGSIPCDENALYKQHTGDGRLVDSYLSRRFQLKSQRRSARERVAEIAQEVLLLQTLGEQIPAGLSAELAQQKQIANWTHWDINSAIAAEGFELPASERG